MPLFRDESGTTVVLTTHYLDEADALADRLVVVDRGLVAAEGTPDALKTRYAGLPRRHAPGRLHSP